MVWEGLTDHHFLIQQKSPLGWVLLGLLTSWVEISIQLHPNWDEQKWFFSKPADKCPIQSWHETLLKYEVRLKNRSIEPLNCPLKVYIFKHTHTHSCPLCLGEEESGIEDHMGIMSQWPLDISACQPAHDPWIYLHANLPMTPLYTVNLCQPKALGRFTSHCACCKIEKIPNLSLSLLPPQTALCWALGQRLKHASGSFSNQRIRKDYEYIGTTTTWDIGITKTTKSPSFCHPYFSFFLPTIHLFKWFMKWALLNTEVLCLVKYSSCVQDTCCASSSHHMAVSEFVEWIKLIDVVLYWPAAVMMCGHYAALECITVEPRLSSITTTE